MGWFQSNPTPPAGPKPSSDGAFEAPDRSSRAHCWEARDAYFACLDRAGIIDSVTNKDQAAAQCGPEGKGFETNCASSWVQYFKKRRIVDYKKEQTMKQLEAEGAKPLPQGQIPGQS